MRGAGVASDGFLASRRATFGLTGSGFVSGTTFAGSGCGGDICCFCSGGATTSGFSCIGVGAISCCTGCAAAGAGGDASASCIAGPGGSSVSEISGAEVIGVRSTSTAGTATPGGGAETHVIPSASSAACTARIAAADRPQRRSRISPPAS
ncbi:hypothetical protein ABIF21_006096 [Bradyrhizobium elkanii]